MPPIRLFVAVGFAAAVGVTPAWAQTDPPDAKPIAANASTLELTPPPEIPNVTLAPALKTTAVRRGSAGFNVQMVDTALLPRDKSGIWVLDFAFKPVRIITSEIGGKRRQLHYMYYRVINHTGKPQMFVPQFSLVTDTGKRYEDTVVPSAVKNIQAREEPTIPLLGAVNIMGTIPPSTKEGVDDAVFGVAIWDNVDPHADRFQIYVRGLSDGLQVIPRPQDAAAKAPVKPIIRYKALRVDFVRRGDEHNLNEKEIQLLDPPYEWVYW
ncbi:hypothetical protein ACYOEI_18360 [Singulisphaera rosea]